MLTFLLRLPRSFAQLEKFPGYVTVRRLPSTIAQWRSSAKKKSCAKLVPGNWNFKQNEWYSCVQTQLNDVKIGNQRATVWLPRPPTDRVLFHGRTHLATEALLLSAHVFGTASQDNCATKTLVITVFSVNSKRFGFNVASGAQCDIPINCTIQIAYSY